jgi:hypothetical protein
LTTHYSPGVKPQVPQPSILRCHIKKNSIIEEIRNRCRESDADLDCTSKVVTAAKGIKNVPAGGGLVGGGILNLQVREAERVLKRKLKELNQ